MHVPAKRLVPAELRLDLRAGAARHCDGSLMHIFARERKAHRGRPEADTMAADRISLASGLSGFSLGPINHRPASSSGGKSWEKATAWEWAREERVS